MKKYLLFFIFIFNISCSVNDGVYWCGDHPCINKNEKEAYFKKTMIVEVRNYDKNKMKSDSEIQKLLNQAKLDEKKRILTEKEIQKKTRMEEKELTKQIKLEEKRRIKEEKELSKQIKLEEKRRIKEEKELSKQIKLEEKRRIKEEKELTKKIKNEEKSKINTDTAEQKVVKLDKKKSSKDKVVIIGSHIGNVEISTDKFDDLVKKILKRNSPRPYPEINDIPK